MLQRQTLIRILTHLGTLVLGIFLTLLTLGLILGGDIYEYQDSVDGVHLPPIDAIVCLAGGGGVSPPPGISGTVTGKKPIAPRPPRILRFSTFPGWVRSRPGLFCFGSFGRECDR